MKFGYCTYHFSEIIWLRKLLKWSQVDYSPTLLYRENQNALHLQANLIFHEEPNTMIWIAKYANTRN